MAEEVDHLGGMDRAGIEPEVEVPPGDPGCRREHLPVEMMLQHRGLPARRPGAHPLRPFVHSAFVDEDDRAPLAAGFFLIRGHVTLCHCRIACSSRSSALPLGRWQLQLSLRRMRQTWSSWYRTPVRYSMTARTRLAVHSPLAKPNASGPRWSARSRSRNWAGLSLGGRPVRLAWRSPRTPDCSSSCAQRLTDCRWTPTARATWDWLSPCRSNRPPPSAALPTLRNPAAHPLDFQTAGTFAAVAGDDSLARGLRPVGIPDSRDIRRSCRRRFPGVGIETASAIAVVHGRSLVAGDDSPAWELRG